MKQSALLSWVNMERKCVYECETGSMRERDSNLLQTRTTREEGPRSSSPVEHSEERKGEEEEAEGLREGGTEGEGETERRETAPSEGAEEEV